MHIKPTGKSLPNVKKHVSLLLTFIALAWTSLAFSGEIHDAARSGDLEKVKTLLKHDPSLVSLRENEYGDTPLHLAALAGHLDVVRVLIDNKADVNAKNKEGYTPLHLASEMDYTEVVDFLRQNGGQDAANVDAQSTTVTSAGISGANATAVGFAWNDGFLEKEYSISTDERDKVACPRTLIHLL
jgi:ankyrin repeat protein